MSERDFQLQKVQDLKSGKLHYKDASIYTILLEMCLNNETSEVQLMLHCVANDLKQRAELEKQFDGLKTHIW